MVAEEAVGLFDGDVADAGGAQDVRGGFRSAVAGAGGHLGILVDHVLDAPRGPQRDAKSKQDDE